MFRDEFDDGYDTVEWAAAQPWSNGRVGLYGTSYGANTSWQAAIADPPALGAIAPTQAPIDYVEGWPWLTRDGILKWGLTLNWTLTAIVESQVRRHSRPDERDERLRDARGLDGRSRELFAMTPLRKVGDVLQEVIGPAADGGARQPLAFFRKVVERALPDEWARLSIERSHRRVRVPAFITASWYDVILGHDLEHYARMKRDAATAEARDQHPAPDRPVVARDVPERRRRARLRPPGDGRLARPRRRSRHDPGRVVRAQLGGDAATRGRRATRPALRAGRQPLARRGRLAARAGGAHRVAPPERRAARAANRPPTDEGDDPFVVRPAPPVPDPRRRPREAARLRTRAAGPGTDPRSAATCSSTRRTSWTATSR